MVQLEAENGTLAMPRELNLGLLEAEHDERAKLESGRTQDAEVSRSLDEYSYLFVYV